jgi:hypothetical protein
MGQGKSLAFLKFLASFFKPDWQLADYPIRVRQQDPHAPGMGLYLPEPWIAQIVNWWQMIGSGNTKEEALSSLQRNFDEYKQENGSLPRPGMPVRLEFALTGEIDQHIPLARDFFQRILNMNYDDCFVSDQSSLWDFPDTEDTAAVFARIRLAYGVDVSDIFSGNLARIFKRIKDHNRGRF